MPKAIRAILLAVLACQVLAGCWGGARPRVGGIPVTEPLTVAPQTLPAQAASAPQPAQADSEHQPPQQASGHAGQDQPPSQADPLRSQLAQLTQTSAEQQTQLEQLRARLARMAGDLYDAADHERRPALVAGYLSDPLAEVRLAGLRLVERRAASDEPVPAELVGASTALLADPSESVRSEAALLAATLMGPQALDPLLARLAAEPSATVRESLLRSLGQLRLPQALPAVLGTIQNDQDNVAAAGAAAVANIAARNHLDEQLKRQAVGALVQRYLQAGGEKGLPLREAALTALGVLADGQSSGLFQQALTDESPRIRLAAVNGVAKLGQADLADGLAPLAADPDRGVRQAVLVALGSLDGPNHLQAVLARTEQAVEPDAAVRQQAWDVAMTVLSKSSDQMLEQVAGQLQRRDDCQDQRIRVLGMLVAQRQARKSPALPLAQRTLGQALMEAGRPAEAAEVLKQAVANLDEGPQRNEALLAWVASMLAADDPAAVATIAGIGSPDYFARALTLLDHRLGDLADQSRWVVLAPLARQAIDRLRGQLSPEQLQHFQEYQAQAAQRLREQDRQQVAQLAPQLWGPDKQAQLAAHDELVRMSARAVGPLLGQLRGAITAPQSAAARERALVEVLGLIEPRLAGYDLAMPLADKLKLIDGVLASIPQP